jgi:hypothetical protein
MATRAEIARACKAVDQAASAVEQAKAERDSIQRRRNVTDAELSAAQFELDKAIQGFDAEFAALKILARDNGVPDDVRPN